MQAEIDEIKKFLDSLKLKIKIWGPPIFIDDRKKNSQFLLDIEMSPKKRLEIINDLTYHMYYEGPKKDNNTQLDLYVFGYEYNTVTIYIKIHLGKENDNPVCISFHEAEFPISYQFKKQ